jgi:hypothetical protein
MARKDTMLKAFLSNEKFCTKYNITADSEITIYKALQSKLPELVALAKIIDKYDDENTNKTPLYQQVINLLNSKS